MKKTLIVLVMALVAVSLFVGCKNEPVAKNYTVTFDVDGNTTTIPSKTVTEGSTVAEPTDKPTKTGKVFDYWATEKNGAISFDFDTAITADTTLYAVFRNYRAGDTVNFGIYPANYVAQNLQNQPVAWKVLEVDTTNSKVLVISENVLGPSVWSEVDSYLSGLISIFELDEVNFQFTTIDGTIKTMFLLSTAEVNSYFGTSSKIAYYGSTAFGWWLRTNDNDSGSHMCVKDSGEVEASGSDAWSGGVRPAMWVSFSN